MSLMQSPSYGLPAHVAHPDFGEETTAEHVMGTLHSSALLEGTLSTIAVHPVQVSQRILSVGHCGLHGTGTVDIQPIIPAKFSTAS